MTRRIKLASGLLAAGVSLAGAVQASPPAPSVPPNAACAPPPVVGTGALGRHEQAADQILKNFNTAYRQACFKGVMHDQPLISPGSVPAGRLFLKNAPDANDASIYNEGEEGAPGRMVLEYPFIADDGAVSVPSADDLEEAIFCAVQGATAAEQEKEGRCLPD